MKRLLSFLTLVTPALCLLVILNFIPRDGSGARFFLLAFLVSAAGFQLRDFFDIKSTVSDRGLERLCRDMSRQISQQSGIEVCDVLVDRSLELNPIDDVDLQPNARSYALYPNRKIVVDGEIFSEYGESGALAVIAHEHAHCVLGHHVKRLCMQAAFTVLGCLILFAFRSFDAVSSLLFITFFLLSFLVDRKSRRHDEFEADRLAAKWVGSDVFASLLDKMKPHEKKALHPVLDDHPSIEQRIAGFSASL